MRQKLLEIALVLGTVAMATLGGYELTAKSPRLLGQPLPGWRETQQVEHLVAWRRPTHIFPVDKLLHEGREAWLYYGMMIGLVPATARRPGRIFRPADLPVSAAAVAVPRDPAPTSGKPRTSTPG